MTDGPLVFDVIAALFMIAGVISLFSILIALDKWADRAAARRRQRAVRDELARIEERRGTVFQPPPLPAPGAAPLPGDLPICSAGSHDWIGIEKCTTCGSTRRRPARRRNDIVHSS